MNITKQNFNKLKQLDRIEFRQRIIMIRDLGNTNAKKFLLSTLLIIMLSFYFPKASTVILVMMAIYYIAKAFSIDDEFRILEEEYFTEEVKLKK